MWAAAARALFSRWPAGRRGAPSRASRWSPLTVPAGIYSFAEDTRRELYVAAMDGRVWRLVGQ